MKAQKIALMALAMPLLFHNSTNGQDWKQIQLSIPTRWAKKVNENKPLSEYPRPGLERRKWQNLNGIWEYSITRKDSSKPTSFTGKILVPYPIESALSGVKQSLKPEQILWYKRRIEKPNVNDRQRVILNFGAVDFDATVYLNDKEIGKHTGGYQSFSIDVTEALKVGDNELIVKVWDPSDQGINPHGKQVLNPQGIMYTPSSGIWQTVWLETVPADYIKDLKITPDVDKGEVRVEVSGPANAAVEVKAFEGKREIASSRTPRNDGQITLKIPDAKLWSPDDPFLYDLEVTLGKDKVKSYFGMRKIEVKKDEKGIDRIFLNDKYTYNLGTLDQGFWPDGLYTAPTDEALVFDIKASKAMGFNTIRKHIKIESSRWYYWADKLGMLVWQDMVNPGNNTPEGRAQFEKENKVNISQLYNHPSIVTWVLFNEKWGQYDQERLTKELKELDPTRLVNGHSGEMLYVNDALRSPSPNAWIGSDMTDVHAYPNPGHIKFAKGKAAVLGEFGGIGVPVEGHLWDDLKAGWGYDGVVTPPILRKQYADMVDSLKKLEAQGLTASIYTQPFDVETEQNGLMTYDREVIKLPVEVIRQIHARLWPVTKNYLTGSKSFSARIADTVSKTYAVRLKEYLSGARDSSLLRSLTIMAAEKRDSLLFLKTATQYIKQLKNPLVESNLKFIQRFTNSSKDVGFAIFFDNVEAVDNILGQDEAGATLRRIIDFNEVLPEIRNESINWNELESRMEMKYGELGRETVLQTKIFTSVNKNDWKTFGQSAGEWFKKYGSKRKKITTMVLNQFAWLAFEKADDLQALEAALLMAEQCVRIDGHGAMIDTYANLLYKLGRKEEAIKWEEKAVVKSEGDREIKTNLEKMKVGAKTWLNSDN